MKARMLLIATVELAQAFCANGDNMLDESFVSLYAMIGDTNISQNAFIDAIDEGSSNWYASYVSARTNIADQALRDWFCTMAMSSASNKVGYSRQERWLNAKAVAMCRIGAEDAAVCEDTNCWFAVAREHGMIRDAIHSDAEWDSLRGATSRHVDDNGIVFITVPDAFSENSRLRHMQVNDMIQKEALYKDFLSRINCVFAAFAGSATFTAMPPPERNAIVSNLVETARFTAEEAAALGLTNVTTHVEE